MIGNLDWPPRAVDATMSSQSSRALRIMFPILVHRCICTAAVDGRASEGGRDDGSGIQCCTDQHRRPRRPHRQAARSTILCSAPEIILVVDRFAGWTCGRRVIMAAARAVPMRAHVPARCYAGGDVLVHASRACIALKELCVVTWWRVIYASVAHVWPGAG